MKIFFGILKMFYLNYHMKFISKNNMIYLLTELNKKNTETPLNRPPNSFMRQSKSTTVMPAPPNWTCSSRKWDTLGTVARY